MPAENLRVIFAARPTGSIVPSQTFRLDRAPIPELQDGQVLVRVQLVSLDPAMRGMMNDVRSYIAPMQPGEVMRSNGAGVVVASRYPGLKEGDRVQGPTGWQEFAAVPGRQMEKLDGFPEGATTLEAMSVLGGTGLTAYFGMLDVGRPKAGETVVVSGAAGATGLVAAQIGKILGCRVIGIAGGKDKCAFLKNELGLDEALDYKDPEFRRNLAKATPKFIDMYFDNVGGEVLDACLARIATRGRIVACGAISQYNTTEPYALRSYTNIITQRVRLEGFILFDYAKRYGEGRKQLAQWLREGKLKNRDTVVKGLQNAPEALVQLFAGANVGKMLVEVAPEAPAKL
ncbi:zinc-binding dehydrogenase [Hyaloraphidium curvatum]|nr:zinc-binding dehydrogenase [Hyaloraphidium curvatum]